MPGRCGEKPPAGPPDGPTAASSVAGIAAGTVVVWEAQGTLSRWDGERIHWRHDNDVVASNGLIIRELQHYLQQYPWLDSINQR